MVAPAAMEDEVPIATGLPILDDVATEVISTEGGKYLSEPLLHCDLKSTNVLIFNQWVAKLTDFGVASHGGILTTLGTATRHHVGTCQYWAPELFDDEPFTPACDVYAFGVLMWELSTRLVPWAGKSQWQVTVPLESARSV